MLIKSPESQTNCVEPIQYYKAARDAFSTILQNIDFSGNKALLLPAYIGITDREGSGVFDPVLQTKIPFSFYTLDKTLSADKNELYNPIKSRKFRALLIIHYFGFCQNDMTAIYNLCKEYNMLLIEDCAHSMKSECSHGELGFIGDFSIYSLHKILATNDGGYLRVNNKKFEYLLKQSPITKPTPETLYLMSKSDLNTIRLKRRSNYLKMLELIGDISIIEIMFPKLPDGITPHNFPIIVKGNKREELYFRLIENGVPVIALYYRMINPIKDGDYSNAHYLSANILNFPIHQDIEVKDIKLIKKELLKSYG